MRAVLTLCLLLSIGCTHGDSNNAGGTSSGGSSASSSADATGASTAAPGASGACDPARAGFECVRTPDGPAMVLAASAPADLDPCPLARCPASTRCESSAQQIGPASHRLPRCVAITPPATPPAPTRDPCANYGCPRGYHCTAPADAPYCVPESAGW